MKIAQGKREKDENKKKKFHFNIFLSKKFSQKRKTIHFNMTFILWLSADKSVICHL